MKKITLLLFILTMSMSSLALTRKEFLDRCKYTDGLLGSGYFFAGKGYGGLRLYSDGTGGWYSSTSWFEEYDGARADWSFGWERVRMKWEIIDDNHLRIKFTQVDWNSYDKGLDITWKKDNYALDQRQVIKRRIINSLEEEKAIQKTWVGKSVTFEIKAKYDDEYIGPDGYYIHLIAQNNTIWKVLPWIDDKTIEFMCDASDSYVAELTERDDQYNSDYMEDEEEEIYIPPTPAYYPGGENEISKYVLEKIQYPEDIDRDGIDMEIGYSLTIDTVGNVVRVSALDGYRGTLVDRTKNLLLYLPKRFTPATEYGKNTQSTYDVYIHYSLSPALTVDRESLSFSYEKETKQINVTSRKPWTFVRSSESAFTMFQKDNSLKIISEERDKFAYNKIKEEVIIRTDDGVASYTITLTQDGAPEPYIKPEKNNVTIPRDGSEVKVRVYSNRDWTLSFTGGSSKISASKSSNGNTVILSAKKNILKKGRAASYLFESTDGDCTASLNVYQNGRGDESKSKSVNKVKEQSMSAADRYWDYYGDYYDECGLYWINILNLRLGGGFIFPPELYIPLNLEALTFRIHMVEVALGNIRFDFIKDYGYAGLAWEPQLRFLIPLSERWAMLPYIGPTCYVKEGELFEGIRSWSASGGLIFRFNWFPYMYSEFSVGYHGGYPGESIGGISVGISIGAGIGIDDK